MKDSQMLDRFTVTASAANPEIGSQGVRTQYVEDAWLPFLGPAALLFARKCDHALSNLQNGQQSVAIIVSRWAEVLGVYPEEVIAAKNRLLRFGLATWEDKTTVLSLHRHWPAVPAAIMTPEHRALLLSISDIALPALPA